MGVHQFHNKYMLYDAKWAKILLLISYQPHYIYLFTVTLN